MEYVTADVYLPASAKVYHLRFPQDLNVQVAAMLTAKSLSELSEGNYLPSKASCLAWRGNGALLDMTKTLHECGVINSSELLLI